MNWLLSNLFLILLLGSTALLAGWWCWCNPRTRNILFTIGSVLIATASAGTAIVLRSSPGREGTVIQPKSVPPKAPLPKDLLTILRMPWDSNKVADWPAALTMAVISDLSYRPPHDAIIEFRKLGFAECETFINNSMAGYVVHIEDAVVIAFRGTDDIFDWLANANRFPARTKHGPIHRGFKNAYESLKPQVVDILNGIDFNHLWITGHSLGGALAVVCAYDMISNLGYEVKGLITFGQPMVARGSLKKYLDTILDSRFAYFVNESDAVPRIPPSFQHSGSLVWYTGGEIRRSRLRRERFAGQGEVGISSSQIEEVEIKPLTRMQFRVLAKQMRNKNFGTAIDGTPLVGGNSPFIQDHGMELYLERLTTST